MVPNVRILLFTGDGKGKTTAALGLALRAAGHQIPVAIVQFIKSDADVGEIQAAGLLPGVSVFQTGRGFLPNPGRPIPAEHQIAARQGLALAQEFLAGGRAAMVILDEICMAVARNLLSEEDVLAVLEKALPGTCIVLTGRGATPGLLAVADTVTEMREIKHGYHAGITAQQGVEW